MVVKRWLAGAMTSCCLFVATVSTASALSLDEFDRLVDYQKENFISTVLHYEYYRYRSDPQSAHKADCMVRLDRSTAGDADTRLLSLILRDLNGARARNSGADTVEGVIRAVIARECDEP